MQRKIIQLAKNTLVVSLPAKWAKLHGVKKGDEVDIEEKENILKLSPKIQKDESSTIIKIKGKDHFLRRIIDTPYRMGYNEIRIEFDDPKIYYKIQDEINNLMGFEIIRQGDGYCNARNIAEGIESEFKNSYNRLFLVTIAFLEDLLENFDNPEKLEIIKNNEGTTNRLAHFCKRMLNLEKVPNSIRSRSAYRITCLLEEIGDIGKKICNHQMNKKIKSGRDNQEYLNRTIQQLRQLYKLTQKFEKEKVPKYGNLEKANEKLCFEILEKKEKNYYITISISYIVENIKHMSEEVFE